MKSSTPKKPRAKPKPKAPVKPIRLRGTQAAQFIGVGLTKFWELSHEDVFTLITGPEGRKKGHAIFYLVDELELYALSNDPEKVRVFRREQGRLKDD